MTEKKIIKITFNNAKKKKQQKKTRVKRTIGQNIKKYEASRGLNQQSLHSKAIVLTIEPRPKVTSLGYLKSVILRLKKYMCFRFQTEKKKKKKRKRCGRSE